MPNKCSIINCGATSSRNQPNLSFHRLPQSKNKKRMWLEIIGKENLRTDLKNIYICSLHFEENAFNRTLDVLRLKDDAVPSLFVQHPSTPHQSAFTERDYNLDMQQNVALEPSTLHQTAFTARDYNAASQQKVEHLNTLTLQQSATTTTDDTTASHQNLKLDQMLKELKKLQEKVENQKKKIKCLNETIRRQNIKIQSFKEIIKELKENNLVTHENCILLEQCAGPKDLILRQISKVKGLPVDRQYSEEIRKFALTLNFMSPKAYDFVRTSYNLCLPHPRTLCKWYEHINAEPGFCKEAFDTLKVKVECNNGPIICALILDEMSIRKSLCWDPKSQKYYGRVNTGIDIESDSVEVASQSLVFLLNCVNGKWKLPVAYFLINTLNGEQKAALLRVCLQKCKEIGVKIISVTCDGPAANFSMFAHMGCNLMETSGSTCFEMNDEKMYCFLDPCHAVKLIRNTFGELKLFYDVFGRKIDFCFLERLLKLQESEGLHMGTKITKVHIYFAKQKMKVRLATQMLSNSVADALEYCSTELELSGFEDCEGTIQFIRVINDVFDVLNSCSIRPPGWKKAMCPENIGLIQALFEGAISYINGLKFPSGQLIVESKRKTGFIGLIIDMKSALDVYHYLVTDTKMLKYFPVYKVSQDHVELFFSSIRARGGFNNNPNAIQFRAAFKRLLIRAEIRDGGAGNCIPLEQINILTCSSRNDPVDTINDLTSKKSFIEVPEDDSNLFEDFLDCLNNNISKYSESVVTYIAGFVARKLSRNVKCDICASMLFGDIDPHSLIKFKSRGGLVFPSKDIEDLCIKTEKILKFNFKKPNFEKYYLYIFTFIIENYCEQGFESQSSDHDANHKYLLMKSVIKTYLDIRFNYFGKKCNEKISFRNYLNKIVLFRNE